MSTAALRSGSQPRKEGSKVGARSLFGNQENEAISFFIIFACELGESEAAIQSTPPSEYGFPIGGTLSSRFPPSAE